MSALSDSPLTPRAYKAVLKGLDRLVRSGRMTEEEAARIRDAPDASALQEAVLAVRVRHAGGAVDAAVADGSMTSEEGTDILRRIGQGEHSHGLRALLHRFRKGDANTDHPAS